jgi:uncharacterized membrane protein YdbT with pleckstrin-like domain
LAEETVWRGSPSPLLGLTTYLICGLVAVIGFALIWVSASLALVVILLAGICGAFKAYLITMTQYTLTTERLQIRKGLLTKRTESLELYRVKDVSLVEPLAYRLLGLGNLVIQSSDMTSPAIMLAAMRDARGVWAALRENVEQCRQKKGVREIDVTREV